jgi:hypothetical protein
MKGDVMTASEWKEKGRAGAEVVELTLPSGMVIRARRPGALQYAAWDRLPLMLAAAAEKGAADIAVAEAQEIAGFLRELLVYCCLEPRVSMTPAEGEIHPREIPEADWMFIVSWAMRLKEVEELRPFRGERADGGGGDDGEAVFAETVRSIADRRRSAGIGVRPGGDAAGFGSGE